MTLARISTRLLLRPKDVPPSRDDFEVVGVFNPGAVRLGDEVVLLVRVAEKPKERRPGFKGLPRWDPNISLTIDWVPDHHHDFVDPRVVRRKADGLIRLNFASHLRVVRCGADGAAPEVTEVVFLPRTEEEEYGVEDPRITAIDDDFTSRMLPSRDTARRRQWPPRPTSGRLNAMGSSSVPKIRMWFFSLKESGGPSPRFIDRSVAALLLGRRCGLPDHLT